jgi:aryl-phospho-beta-D-glucosidase BglC (GH1 family)
MLQAEEAAKAGGPMTPAAALPQMMAGINIGNTMENSFNGPVREYYFDDYRKAGFSAVRLPVNWGNHGARTAPYDVAPAWMDKVEQVVDWALQRGFFVVLNGHHEDWLKKAYQKPENRARYDRIWEQVAHRFSGKSDRLLFEIINEPFGMSAAQVDDLNARILGIIRKENPTRIVVFSGNEYSGADQMMAAAVPDDKFLMAYFHCYDPWSFAGEAQGTWTADDLAKLRAKLDAVAAWSKKTGIPVMMSEFGAVRMCDPDSRRLFYRSYAEEARKRSIAWQVWDDGGNFTIYQRSARQWTEIKDLLFPALGAPD